MVGASQTHQAEGPVAVHRWFPDGEDWSSHPWYSVRTRQLVQVLDGPLKANQEREFRVEAFGGFLVGEVVADLACLDPRAQGRRPSILRVAFVQGTPTEEEQQAVLRALRDLPLPEAPGERPDLSVPVP